MAIDADANAPKMASEGASDKEKSSANRPTVGTRMLVAVTLLLAPFLAQEQKLTCFARAGVTRPPLLFRRRRN
jgi:hypothetical protein